MCGAAGLKALFNNVFTLKKSELHVPIKKNYVHAISVFDEVYK